jgi:hypothetical protein
MIHTDHFSLKYILDQRLTTILQHMWVTLQKTVIHSSVKTDECNF